MKNRELVSLRFAFNRHFTQMSQSFAKLSYYCDPIGVLNPKQQLDCMIITMKAPQSALQDNEEGESKCNPFILPIVCSWAQALLMYPNAY